MSEGNLAFIMARYEEGPNGRLVFKSQADFLADLQATNAGNITPGRKEEYVAPATDEQPVRRDAKPAVRAALALGNGS